MEGFEYDELDENDQPTGKRLFSPPFFETEDQKIERFEKEVLNPIHKGNLQVPTHLYGLDELRGDGQIFEYKADPMVWIITPRPEPPIDDPHPEIPRYDFKLRYMTRVQDIYNEILSIFPELGPGAIQVHDYWPSYPPLSWSRDKSPKQIKDYMRDARSIRSAGKILAQYKPAPDCNGEAHYRLYFGELLLREASWSPSSLVSKRDNSSACDISEVANVSSTSVPASPAPTLTTTPTESPSTTLQATAPASSVSCYKKLSCYNAAAPDTAHSKSNQFCSKYASMKGFSGPNWSGIQSAWNDFSNDTISYNWRVSWKPDCVLDGQGTMNIGQPIATFSCQDAMRRAWDDCEEEQGGTFQVLCLEYSIHLVHQGGAGGDSSCSLPFS
ncbi:hypothetical protein GGR54DRAFT_595982 [Hypoxylon sp. NC1633]|nr:hypothetical protein GGR54DRAFT_595982 [Hypoxylon sp. NC1633]